MIITSKVGKELSNNRVEKTVELPSPEEVKNVHPLSEKASETVSTAREIIQNILLGKDSRRLAIVGPCSVHSEEEIMKYAKGLKEVADTISDKVYVVMRTYFEKPRTTVGWTGFLNDPHLDESVGLEEGLPRARKLLIAINEMGIPCATELLDPVVPQYFDDCIAWACIGARTTESQRHRQMASGLSMPVGFKNATSGDIQIALNAIHSASAPHKFLGITAEGKSCIVSTRGNPYGHIVLRGGTNGPNHQKEDVAKIQEEMKSKNFQSKVMIDASHENSGKDHIQQEKTANEVIEQLKSNPHIVGLMLESYLESGRTDVKEGIPLIAETSITDKCMDFSTTQKVLANMYNALIGD